ncbi:MFS transporter [Herbaspirillum autotrophicum]|uniref:MFS transporter n=1 Tax=Herbaspirillum autotrophicum TaxID=180195 RepID=UPI00067CB793|nr:MFS transporter [Herbaspirillum autotrophicum]
MTTERLNGSAAELAAIYRKISWRVLPLMLVCYFFAYLDRINIGFAKLQMQQDIGISDAVYGLAAGIFFLGYVMFEVPSNLLLVKVGARKTMSRILVLWGLTSAAMLFVRDAQTFYILRFMLGVFEAGFAPGMIFYLTYWYSSSRMAGALAVLMLVGPLGGTLGGPVSTWIMTAFEGSHGMHGWQWMFLLEGLPCVVLGVFAYFFLVDKPADARWLSEREKKLLAADIVQPETSHSSFLTVLKDPRVYVMAFSYFCFICGIYTISFWLPTMIKNAGIVDVMQIGLYSAIPYLVGGVVMLLLARSSDRLRERRWHVALAALAAALALGLAALVPDNFVLFMVCMSVATAGIWAAYTVFWAMPSEYLKGQAAAGGIALINSIGLLGGFFSPSLIGWAKTTYGSLNAGLYVMVGLLVLGSIAVVLNKRVMPVLPPLSRKPARG